MLGVPKTRRKETTMPRWGALVLVVEGKPETHFQEGIVTTFEVR
jgi:hypothetical protein